jgi:hypothetical protein
MIPVFEKDILEKASRMPAGYLSDCRAAAIIDAHSGVWSFSEKDFASIRRKYRGYAVSEADQFREGEIISGCCDRADQY